MVTSVSEEWDKSHESTEQTLPRLFSQEVLCRRCQEGYVSALKLTKWISLKKREASVGEPFIL